MAGASSTRTLAGTRRLLAMPVGVVILGFGELTGLAVSFGAFYQSPRCGKHLRIHRVLGGDTPFTSTTLSSPSRSINLR